MVGTGAENVSSGASSSAPPPDSAATSAPPAADAAQAPAATQGTEAAASTETGATAAPSSLDDIWKDFSSRAEQEQAAPEAPADAITTPAPATEPKPEEQTVGEGKPADDADEVKAEDDPLADDAKIPTRDEINEQFPRAPKPIRELAAELAEKAAASEAKLAKLGGDEGLEVAAGIIPHLFTTQVTPESVNGMFEALVDTNPQLVAAMGEAFVNEALNDERTGAAFGDRLLQSEFGEGYTADRLRELVELDRQGLIDVESLREDLGTGREPTARERELEAKLDAATKQVKELTGGREDATRREEQRLAQTVKQAVSRAVMAKVLPIADKIGWVEKEGNKGPHAGLLARLGKLAVAEMNAGIEQTPEWDAIQQLVSEGTAFRDEQPTRLMRVQLSAIAARGRANFKATARELKPLISLLAGQNAPPPSDDPPPPPTPGRSGDDATTTTERPAPTDAQQQKPQTLEEINEQFDRRMRESRAPVGSTRRR
jgi:hypothetical protein